MICKLDANGISDMYSFISQIFVQVFDLSFYSMIFISLSIEGVGYIFNVRTYIMETHFLCSFLFCKILELGSAGK